MEILCLGVEHNIAAVVKLNTGNGSGPDNVRTYYRSGEMCLSADNDHWSVEEPGDYMLYHYRVDRALGVNEAAS